MLIDKKTMFNSKAHPRLVKIATANITEDSVCENLKTRNHLGSNNDFAVCRGHYIVKRSKSQMVKGKGS